MNLEGIEMPEIQGLEFRMMSPGQAEEVCRLVLEVLNGDEKSVFTPDERKIVERYAAPEAMERRIFMGYRHELVYVSGVLTGMIETKGPDQVSMLYIRPAYTGKGLGSRLIARAAARCAAESPKTNKTLFVYAADETIPFYERVGFVRGGARKVVGGVHSSLYKLPLTRRERMRSSKMHASSVDLFVFTGTGNSLLVARTAAETLKQEGLPVRLRSMDAPCPNPLGEEAALGLAFPVACFSTYPAVWRFIESLPAGNGREAFVMGTCGGFPGGMQGPLGKVLREKGYNPIAAKFFVMPGNYANKKLPVEKNAMRIERAILEARSFACDLLKGQTEWSNGIPLLSGLMYRLGQTRKPWDFFYRLFPIAADSEKCARCGRCVRNCPARAVTMEPAVADGCPVVEPRLCESCQRCVGFCPTSALHVPGKPAEPYRAMSYEEYLEIFKAAFD
jgi:ferredoxin/GNAT superfamily N-acetyltransferase